MYSFANVLQAAGVKTAADIRAIDDAFVHGTATIETRTGCTGSWYGDDITEEWVVIHVGELELSGWPWCNMFTESPIDAPAWFTNPDWYKKAREALWIFGKIVPQDCVVQTLEGDEVHYRDEKGGAHCVSLEEFTTTHKPAEDAKSVRLEIRLNTNADSYLFNQACVYSKERVRFAYELEFKGPTYSNVKYGWRHDEYRVSVRPYGQAWKNVCFTDGFDFNKPARIKKTRRGEDLLVNDAKGKYYRFLALAWDEDDTKIETDGAEIVWQATDRDNIYLVVAFNDLDSVFGIKDRRDRFVVSPEYGLRDSDSFQKLAKKVRNKVSHDPFYDGSNDDNGDNGTDNGDDDQFWQQIEESRIAELNSRVAELAEITADIINGKTDVEVMQNHVTNDIYAIVEDDYLRLLDTPPLDPEGGNSDNSPSIHNDNTTSGVTEVSASEGEVSSAIDAMKGDENMADKEIVAAAEKVKKMFDEMKQDGQVEFEYWHPYLLTFVTEKRKEFDDLRTDEVNAIVAKYYGVEVSAPISGTPSMNRHFVGWYLGNHQITCYDEHGEAIKNVGYGDTFDWSKPATFRKTRKGKDFMVNDENGMYFQFLCVGSGTHVDGEIIWKETNSYGDTYMIVAVTPSPDPDKKDFDNTPSDNIDNSVTPEISTEGGEVSSAVDAMKKANMSDPNEGNEGGDSVEKYLRFEPGVNLTLWATESITIGGNNDSLTTAKMPTVFGNTDEKYLRFEPGVNLASGVTKTFVIGSSNDSTANIEENDVTENPAPLMLPAPSFETATVAAMNMVVDTPAVIIPVPVHGYITALLPAPSTAPTFSLQNNMNSGGNGFDINTVPFAGQEDIPSSIVYNAAEEQPGDFADGEGFSSQFTVVTATVPFDIQRFSDSKKGENSMKKTKTNKIKAKGGRKILSPFAIYAKQIAIAEEKARDDAKGFNVQVGLEDLATNLDTKVSNYAASLPEDVEKEHMIERYVFVLATEIGQKYRDSVAGPQINTDAQIINHVNQIIEMAHLIAEREGGQMNVWKVSFGNIEENEGVVYRKYFAQIAHISYNRIVKAADLGIGGIRLGTTRVKIGDLTDMVDRFCPDLVELNFLGNLDEVVGLAKGLYGAKTERSADIIVAFRHGLPSVFIENLETGEYDAYIHKGLYTADIKTEKFLQAFIAKRDKVAATIEKLPEYEETEIKKVGANPETVRQKYADQKKDCESKLASYNDQIDHLTDKVRTSQQVPTTLNGIMEWASEVRRVEKDFWLSSAGMLKQSVYLVPTRRIDTPDERDFGAFYDYATTGTYRHICRMTEGQELSPKQFSQYANRFSNTMAPGRLFDETVPEVIAITPHKLGVTTDGQFLLNGEYVQDAFNTIHGYYFTLAAVCTLAIQCRPGTVSIKGVGDTVYPDVMRARIAAEIKKLNVLPHHPDQKPDKNGNFIVRIVAGELTEQEEKDFFEFRENQKNAHWQNCLVLRYTNREEMARDLENGNIPTVSVFVDFNSFKCTAEAKPVLDKEGNPHSCDTGLHVLSVSHKSMVSNMSSQLLTSWLAASPKETMAKVHAAVNPSIARQWIRQRDCIPGVVSATEMRPRTIWTEEGESDVIIPDYNRLSGVAAPLFGRIYAPDGQAEISKAVRSMSRRFGEFKIPIRCSSYFVACDPILLFGGNPVLQAQEGYCEVLTKTPEPVVYTGILKPESTTHCGSATSESESTCTGYLNQTT